jgi:hypothetical protein
MAERAVRRQTPEVGAGCLNWACPDLCGGGVTRVPTAITYAHTHDGQRSNAALQAGHKGATDRIFRQR